MRSIADRSKPPRAQATARANDEARPMTATSAQEKFWFLGTLVTIRVAAASNADGISMTEHRIPRGFSPPLHVHHTEDEIFHITAGEARFVVGSKELTLQAGDTMVAPKGVPHCFVVTSEEARWINVTASGDFERMIRAAGVPADYDGLPTQTGAPTPEQAAALAQACRANGIELIGPPMKLTDVAQEVAA
jgi:mannose-6-phosphate isomerase-like protein (cupin superfamily)